MSDERNQLAEQSVLDAIDELVEWQLAEGKQRGDRSVDETAYFGPDPAYNPDPHHRQKAALLAAMEANGAMPAWDIPTDPMQN